MFFNFNRMVTGSAYKALRSVGSVPAGASRVLGTTASAGPSTYNMSSFDTPSLSGRDVFLDIKEWLPRSKTELYRLYRNIYDYDTVAGTAVDLIVTLPFSDIHLVHPDQKILDIYEESLDRLRIVQQLPLLAAEYYVIGFVVASLIFDDKAGVWDDMVIHSPETIDIDPIPVQGFDPKINFMVPKKLKQFLRSKDPRDVDARSVMPEALIKKLMSSKSVPLEPLNTLYLPRKSHPNDLGTSYFLRIIPLYILEQTLTYGTLISARRRQRAIMHITVGLDDVWEPTIDEIQTITEMFVQADSDPQGAIVGTRTGVQVDEVRQGSDFWKISEEGDYLTQAKLRALGLNESFLSGDATYSTMEVALSVFVESLRAFRDDFTQRIFYHKLFPTLAKANGFIKRTQAELSHRIRIVRGKHEETEYQMPEVHWAKQLKPEADMNYLDVLEKVEEKGVVIPLRTWAAAAGMSLKNLLAAEEDDIEVRKKIKDWKKKAGLLEEEEGGGGGADAWGRLASARIWDRNDKFAGVSKEEAKKLVRHALISKDSLRNVAVGHLGEDRADVGLYLLRKAGIAKPSISVNAAKKIVAHLKKLKNTNEVKRVAAAARLTLPKEIEEEGIK